MSIHEFVNQQSLITRIRSDSLGSALCQMSKALPSWAIQTHSHLPDLLAGGGRFSPSDLWRDFTLLDAEHTLVELVEWFENCMLISENVVLEPPRNPSSKVVSDGGAGRDRENVVQLFQCSLLGFWDKQEDHAEGQHIQRAMMGFSMQTTS